MNHVLTKDALFEQRRTRYRQRANLRVRTVEQAVEFFDDVGLSLLFSAKDIELPTFYGALAGSDEPMPAHFDDDTGRAWQWKDDLPIAGRVVYGKFLRRKPVFISFSLAPHFYVLSNGYGELDDFQERYAEGKLSAEAHQVADALLTHGALPTTELRRVAKLAGKENAARFDRALVELQMNWFIVKMGIAETNAWKYCYVYDLFARRFPVITKAAREINSTQAMSTILLAYLRTVVAVTSAQVCRLFEWEPWRLSQILTRLEASELIYRDVEIKELPGLYLTCR